MLAAVSDRFVQRHARVIRWAFVTRYFVSRNFDAAAPVGLRPRVLRCLAFALLVVYLVWQVYWLSQGSLAPSLFQSVTGWPSATTGGTRSMLCLARGDWRGALYHNALALPLAILTLVSVAWPIGQSLSRQRPALPRSLVIAWIVVLAAAWIVKLTQAALGV